MSRWWYALMAAGGFFFGLFANKRPLGDAVLAHPFMLFAILVGAALLGLRIVSKRPVPELIPDHALLYGCFVGLGLFLVGNFLAAHLLGVR